MKKLLFQLNSVFNVAHSLSVYLVTLLIMQAFKLMEIKVGQKIQLPAIGSKNIKILHLKTKFGYHLAPSPKQTVKMKIRTTVPTSLLTMKATLRRNTAKCTFWTKKVI